ncbi:DUF4347 domain-containing protein [Azospirillum brasilense]|nr:DUF4347 domain-containing protein [Azospirillum brasilense]
MALEPRFMFDAAGAVTAAEVHQQPDQPVPGDKGAGTAADPDKLADWAIKESTVPAASASSPTEPAAVTARLAEIQGSVRSVVFVDTSVSDYQTLLKDIAPDAKVVLLDSQQEALGQMAKALSGMSGLDSVQVVSHGNEGHLYIAGRAYWADGLANRAQALQAIGAALKPGGDILFYACNVGAGEVGQEFVQTIHRLTGADVAVSNDETGNAAGQNWTLEVQSGAIEAAIPFARASMETFSGRLGTVVVTSATGTAAGSLNDAIKNATQSTIIEFSPTLVSGTVSLGVTTALLTAAAQDLTINGDVNGDGIADITISGDGDANNTTTTADYRGIAFNAASKTLTIKNLVFERFYTSSAVQGVLALQNGSLEVDGVTFRNNLSNVIGTLNTATSLTIKNSVFRENTSAVAGTAAFSVIKSQVAGTFTVENSVFVDNNYVMNAGSASANYPGGIIMHQSIVSAFTTNIRNVTIANNSYINNDAGAAGIKTAAIGLFYDPDATGTATANVYNTIIAGNTGKLGATNFSDPNAIIYNSAKITLNAGNNYQNAITGTATFVDSSNATVSLRDYRPASTATTFINTGDSSNANRYGGSYDIRGIDRIRDGALDLGAYEVHWNAGAPTVDLNGAGGGNDESVSSGSPSSGVLIAPSATLAQSDSDTRLLGATITLSGMIDTGKETLTLSTADISTARMSGIAVLANDGATITLSGAASVANYQAVIRLIQYKNSAGSFTAGARTATVTVNDGETTSTARTSTITLGTGADTTPPTVSSIAVSGSPAANASSVTYTVTFSEGVSGVDAGDFTLATTGTATGTIGTVTQVSAGVYTVSVTGVSGTGTLGLNLKGTGTGIKDTANNDIAAGFTGSTHTVDQVAPTFDVAAATSSITNTGFTLSASLNEAGTIYYVLVPRNATAPTAAEVEGGTASGGAAALKSGSLNASSSPFDGSGSISGLTAGTDYDLYVVAKDSAGNLMSAPVKVNVSTTGGSSNAAPVNSVVPSVSGTATVGGSLSAGTGTWSDPDGDPLGYTYQWYRADDSNGTNAASISGATSASYTLTTSDAHKYLRVVVTANDGNGGTQTATSAYTGIANSAPVNSVVPNVTGTATVGSSLSAGTGTWSDPDGDGRSFTYQWYRADDSNGTNAASISGATSSSYTLVAGDLSKYLRVVVTANDGKGGTQSATSAYSSQVAGAGNGAPVNSVVPSVSGTATVGGSLSAGTGTWSDPDGDPLGYTYQWYRADDSNGTNAASISGATSASYTLTSSDAHKYLRVKVTANDGNSNTTTAYSAYTSILNSAPVNSVAPTVTGTATVGNALSTTNGSWSDPDGDNRSFTYQWYRADDSNGTNAASISGATSASYTLTSSDAHKYLRVVVTANDGKGGTQTATSTYTSILNSAPVNSAAPNVTGTATVGNALSTANGTWSDPDGDGRSFTYQWYRADDSNGTNAASISGATSSSYTLAVGDLNKYLRVVVTANDGKGGTQTATSLYSSQVTAAGNGAPVNTVVPTVSGTATVGNALTRVNGSWSDPDGDSLSYTYQWYRADDTNGTNAASISGATSASYTLTSSDAHKYLRVAVIANDGNSNTTTAYSAYTAILNSAPVNSVAPNVTGTATVGNALSTTNGTWSDPDGDGRSFTYQWYRADDSNGTNAASISGATSSSYTLTSSDAHKYLRVVVTANDGKGGTPTATSTYTAILNSAPVNSVAPTVTGTATVGNALSTTNGTWSDPDGDGRSFTYQWYRADDSNGTNAASISGATSSSYTLTSSDAHKYLRVVVTANDGRGGTPTATSTYTAVLNSAPVNSAAPNVTGTATVGNALSTTNGTWSDPDGDGRSFTYQWYRADDSNGTNAASISGATSASYTLTSSDAHKYLRVVVTANDGRGGTPTATSTYTSILNSAPVNSVAPTVTGTATVGNALSTTNGTWSDPDGDGRSFTYQWYRADDSNGTNGASISGATSSSYTLTSSDAHKYLRVVVTANDGKGGTQTATSTYTSILNSAPVNSVAPTVTGTATVGNALSTTNGSWSDPDGDGRSFTYQWYRADDSNGTNAASISGATSASYTLTSSDAHKYLRVVVTANDGKGGTQTATSTYTAILNSAPVNSAAPNVTGTATVGNALSTTNGSWSDPDGDGRSFTYQWYRADDSNGTNAASISGATSSSYTLTTSDAHKYLRVVVTANDGKGGTQTATSTYTAILNSAPVLSTDARSLTAIDEDATGNNGDSVAAILASAGSATDADGNVLGIAITAIDSSNGTWEYKTGAGNWTTITGVSGASALLLASTDRVRFVPNADYNGPAANGITFKAWDQTTGTAGTTVGNDTTANGEQGAGGQFSVASATAGIAVTAVNDAPVLTDTVLTLPSVAQAAGAPNGAVGVAVSSLVAFGTNVSDVDSGAVTGIALVGVDTSEGGTWFYSTDGGTTWSAVGTVNDSGNALLLRTTDRLYYQPTGANAGILNAAITFRAWDQTSGTAGTKMATAGGGGVSAFSAATDTASLSITPAALGSALTLAPASDTGNSNSDNITKASSVTFNGSGANANANTTVRLYANGSLVATTTADASGAYSFTGVDVSGLSGAVDFTVRQVIAGMESADSAVRTVTFDRAAPTVAITTVSGDNVLNAAESAVTQTVAGTTTGVEDGQTVTVTLNGKTYSATVTNNAWSLAIPSTDLLGLMDGGTYAITADLADVAGNAAVQATRSVSVDRTPPILAIATVAGDNVLNASDSAVGQTVSGVTNGVEDGQTVTVTLNGKTYSTTVTNNRWSLTVPSTDLLALTDGANYTVTASLTDAAGNPNQATRSVSVDRTPPSVVSVTPPAARTYLPGETVSFFVQLSETVVINGGNPVLELAVGSDIRNASYNAAGSTGTLLRFDYVVPVGDRAPQGISVLGLALNGSVVTDLAQGPLVTALAGIGDTSQVRIDTPIPAKPVGTALSGLSDSGASATDRLTNVTRPTLSGTAEANATVTVLVDGKAVGTTVADENGFWVHRLQTPLTDGTHSITTTATNRFGIVSDPSDALSVVIDTAVPVAPAPSVTSATVAGAAGERISGIAAPSLAGTTEAGSTVNLLVDGKIAGTALADANGAWTFQFTAALADGTHSLQVQATDKAGNVSSLSAVTTLTIDTTPPVAPTVALNTTAGSTPIVQGIAEANSLVSVTVNGQAVGTARASAAGVWQLALAADLSVGSYVIAAKASDAVGNTGNAGTTTYTVAPPPPPPVVAAAASTGNTTTAASSSNSAVGTAAGTGTTQTVGPTLGTAPTLPSLQTSSDAGRVITNSSIGSGNGNGNSSTDAGRSITIGNLGNSSSSDAGRSITISAMGGAPSSGGTASSSSGVLGGGTGGSGGSGLSGVVSGGSGLAGGGLGSGGLGGGIGGGSGLGGTASGGIGAGSGIGGGSFGGAPAGAGPGAGLGAGGPATGGPAAGGTTTGTGTGDGGLNGGVGGPVGTPGTTSSGTPGGGTAPGGPGSAPGGLSGAPGNRPGGQSGPGSTIENAPANRPAGQGGPQGQPQGQGQPPAGDAPAGGDTGNAPAGADGSGQVSGPRADLDGSPLARPAFSRQVAQIHGAADAQSAALLAALTSHVPPGSRAA